MPTNGVGPYSYKVMCCNSSSQIATNTVTGNVLEITETVGTSPAGSGGSAMGYRVMVWDSAGNFGIGFLFVYQSSAWIVNVLEEKVLDYDEDTDGWVFAGPRNLPVGYAFASSYAPTGDGFSYPYPATSVQAIGDRLANTPPGGALCLMYGAQSGGQFALNLLILRRKIDLANSWFWENTSDFLDWSNLSDYTPTVPVGTSSAFTGVTETIAATGKTYLVERACYTQVAGSAPTYEEASLTSGVAVVETQNTAASTRVVTLSLRPGLINSLQPHKEGTLNPWLALMVRAKVTVTLTGNSASVDLRLGKSYTPLAGLGLRIAGTTTLVGGQPAIRIHATRSNFLVNSGTYRKSVFADGSPIGVDFMILGGRPYIALYPWDPAWTDYPEWSPDGMFLPVDGTVGPISASFQDNAGAANSAFPWGQNYPIQTTADINNFSSNNGIFLAATQGNAANGGARIVVEDVRFLWSTMNLGVSR